MRRPELLDRTLNFAVLIVRLSSSLPNRPEGWVIGKQILRSGTSIGANYREAQRSRSKAEFLSKVHICLQEAEETVYWLDLLLASNLVEKETAQSLRTEAEQLKAIFFTIASRIQAELSRNSNT